MKRNPLEKAIEYKVWKFCVENGILYLKLQKLRGYPDRLLLLPNGKSLFIEFKRFGETPRPLQLDRINVLQKYKQEVQVHDNSVSAIAAIKKILEA